MFDWWMGVRKMASPQPAPKWLRRPAQPRWSWCSNPHITEGSAIGATLGWDAQAPLGLKSRPAKSLSPDMPIGSIAAFMPAPHGLGKYECYACRICALLEGFVRCVRTSNYIISWAHRGLLIARQPVTMGGDQIIAEGDDLVEGQFGSGVRVQHGGLVD